MNSKPFQALDHLAIAVKNTDVALELWRDVLGFNVVHSEVVNEGTVRLTHLDLGNTHLQLVEPLVLEHPLHEWMQVHGEGIHHLCFKVEDVGKAGRWCKEKGILPNPNPHQGTQGKRALFMDKKTTAGVQIELTGL